MGMAASQARLLMLTARIHDVEFEAQSIQNAKIQLSTQEDEVYEKYQNALDATTLTFTRYDNGVASTVAATFNNLFSVNGANATSANYALIDSRGRLIVSDDVYEGYYEFISSALPQDAYAFALYMLYGNENNAFEGQDWEDFLEVADEVLQQNYLSDETLLNLYNDAVPHSGSNYELNEQLSGDEVVYNGSAEYSTGNHNVNNVNTSAEKVKVVNDRAASPSGQEVSIQVQPVQPVTPPDPPTPPTPPPVPPIPVDEVSLVNVLALGNTPEAQAFLDYFFHKYGNRIFNDERIPEENLDKFNYYARMFSGIQQHGGCISIDDFNGPSGDAASDTEFLTSMLQSGRWTIEKFTTDADGHTILTGASVSSESAIAYTTTSQIDKVALAKAEAEYEYALKQINRKDKQYDLALSKLETERNALTKQYDSVKKIISDNVERTFGIFS